MLGTDNTAPIPRKCISGERMEALRKSNPRSRAVMVSAVIRSRSNTKLLVALMARDRASLGRP